MALLQTDFLPNKSETFAAFRYLIQDIIGVGALGTQGAVVNPATDYAVTQRGAGADMSVDVAAGSAWVLGKSSARQGAYHQVNDATANVGPFPTAHATLPRIDQVILVVNDSAVIGGSDTPQLVIMPGTATGGATLSNRTGAQSDATINATYPNWIRLADVLMPAAAGSVTNANIGDRRPITYRTGTEIGYDQYTGAAIGLTSTVEGTPTTVITCNPHVFDGSLVMVEFFGGEATCPASAALHIGLYEGAGEIGRLASLRSNGGGAVPQISLSGRLRFQPSAGIHSYIVGGWSVFSSGQVGSTSEAPTFIRFTKV